MNRQAMADELDQRVELMLRGRVNGHSDSLLQLVAELTMLPDPAFKSQLKDQLIEDWDDNLTTRSGTTHPTKSALEPALSLPKGGAPSLVVAQAARVETFERSQGLSLAGMAPLFGGKHTLFPADHRSFLLSFASHAALIALIASGIFVIRVPTVKPTSLTSELTYPISGKGGGGSGDRSEIQATRGTPPKFSDQQMVPPAIVVPNDKPHLAVDSTVVGPPDIKLPQSNHIGDLVSSNIVMSSNGTGSGGGAGDGKGSGLGRGDGSGYGLGSGIGFGGGTYRPSVGVMAPRAIYDPEPEYSEEARRIKYQGTVVLALVVDLEGHARDIHVARSLGMGLDEKAIEAVKKWRFSPGSKDGSPVAMQVNVEVTFRLY
jgi:protein TonB